MAVTALTALLLLCLYCVIFGFSAQDAEQSGGLSSAISKFCVEMVNSMKGHSWSGEEVNFWAAYFEKPIRKLAHFCEYAVMGLLIYTMLRQWKKNSIRLFLLITLWVLLSAAGDEFHQYFVPGRYASPLDVLLDTGGGMAGMFFCIMIEKIYHHWRRVYQDNIM